MKDKRQLLEDAIRRTKVFEMDPSRRRAAAERLHAQGFSSTDVVLVWHVAMGGGRDLQMARGLFAQAVDDPARFREIVRDQQEAERERHQTHETGMAYVADGNPWGWANPDRMRWLDHDRPGEWNAFRRSQNLTAAEARELGTTDHRRHGCSRPEVVGFCDFAKVRRIHAAEKAGKPTDEKLNEATHYWDEGVVEIARGLKAATNESANQGRVYGEESQP